MPRLVIAVLYTGLILMANPGAVHAADLEALRLGDMRKLVLIEPPVPAGEASLLDADDGVHRIADWQGKVVVLNFWATWCAPCREEMPALDRLNAALGGDDLAVLTVATGRNDLAAIRRFYAEAGVVSLPILRDPTQALARQMAVLGLPVTVILNRQGHEVARLTGPAAWDAPEAKAVLAAMIAEE